MYDFRVNDLQNEVIQRFRQGSHVAHDEKHALRVSALAKYIAEQEGYNSEEAFVAGLLHDVGRTVQREEKGHGPAGVPLASELLDTYTDFGAAAKQQILAAVHDHSELHTKGMLTHIVQDADMLDGLGAIGLMRAYTSKAYLLDYDPENIIPTAGRRETNLHEQIAFQMEWYGFMHTETGRKIAKKRYDFMMRFLEQFKREVERGDLH